MTWSLRGYIRKLTSTNQMHCGPMYANNLLSAKIDAINILTSLSELYSSTGIIISCWKTQSSQSFSFQAVKLGALNMNQNFPARSKLLTRTEWPCQWISTLYPMSWLYFQSLSSLSKEISVRGPPLIYHGGEFWGSQFSRGSTVANRVWKGEYRKLKKLEETLQPSPPSPPAARRMTGLFLSNCPIQLLLAYQFRLLVNTLKIQRPDFGRYSTFGLLTPPS